MKKIMIMPDSFKGTLSSLRVSGIIKKELSRCLDPADLMTLPVADGGEGTVDCFMHFTGAERITAKTKGPYMEDMTADYAVTGSTAVIEMCSAAGFSLCKGSSSPLDTTTYGAGLLVKDAVMRGCRRIILGLGGSCTNDCGAGFAAALGAVFTDASGRSFIPRGRDLGRAVSFDISAVSALLDGTDIIAMCDVTNPLCGPEGASYVFAPQKGASPQDVIHLETQMRLFSAAAEKELGIDMDSLPGAGAAGGMGAGVCAFAGGRLTNGIDVILDLAHFDELLDDCSCVITGEGSFDSQSLHGKVINGICRHTLRKGIPVIVVTGHDRSRPSENGSYGIRAVIETGPVDMKLPRRQLIETAERNLRAAAPAILEAAAAYYDPSGDIYEIK